MRPDTDEMSWRERIWLIPMAIILGGVAFYAYWWWMRPPVVEHDNLKYIQLLWTAVSSRNEEWLKGVERAVLERHDAGKMSDSELRHFESIIEAAQNGDWESANRESFAFAEAQLGRRRQKPSSVSHQHSHQHSHEHSHKTEHK